MMTVYAIIAVCIVWLTILTIVVISDRRSDPQEAMRNAIRMRMAKKVAQDPDVKPGRALLREHLARRK